MKKLFSSLWIMGLFACILVLYAPGAGAESTEPTVETRLVPVNGTWSYGVINGNIQNQCFVFEIKKASRATVTVRAFTQCFAEISAEDGGYIHHFSSMPSGSPSDPDTQTYDAYLEPGKYIVSMSGYFDHYGKVGVSVTAKTIKNNETHPNDTFDAPQRIKLDQKIYCLMAQPDEYDIFMIKIPKSMNVLLKLSGNLEEINVDVYNKDISTIYSETVTLYGNPKTSKSKTISLSLPAGNCYIRFAHEYTYHGPYSFTIATPPTATSLKLPKTAVLPVGFKSTLARTVAPKNSELPKMTWKSSKTSIATIDNNGLITAKAKGKTTITAISKDKKLKASCVLSVTDNVFSRSKPIIGKAKGVYVSTKKLSYKGNELCIELFIYNKTGRTITLLDNVDVEVYDLYRYDEYDPSSSIVYSKYLDKWRPKNGSLRNNSYAVLSTKIKKGSLAKLNLASGQYEATLSDNTDFYTKSIRHDRPKIIPIFGQQ